MRRRTALCAVLCTALAVGGCTGVPSSSKPQTIQSLGLGEGQNVAPIAPQPHSDPRKIVTDFLSANSRDPAKHTSARGFLTPAKRNQWSDLTGTVVSDESIGTYDAQKHQLMVYGRVLGTVNAEGVYTPSLTGSGNGGEKKPFVFGVELSAGQYRISALSNGLLLTADEFRSSYQQRVLYFYDAAERYLVPDVRYSALVDQAELADWLLGQLVNGPRQELQSVVSTDTLPAQARRVSVNLGSLTVVQIAGSAQLSPAVRDRLAAQISETLDEAVHPEELTIKDGAGAISIPAVSGTRFSAADFIGAAGPPAPAQDVYYLAPDGRIRTESGKALAGPLASTPFTSVALSRPSAVGDLTVAGVEGSAARQRLVVGTQSGGVQRTSVSGLLSRPAWAPGLAEAWVGAGSKVYRVTTNGKTNHVYQVPIPSAAGGGRVVALRLSPDGSRIAMVVSGANGSGQLYVGSVVRGGGKVHIDTLQPISPVDVVIRDVAWIDPLKLFAIGDVASSKDPRIFETGVDGSGWDSRGISTLPAPPDSLTITSSAPAWVSADGFVWRQNGSAWESPGPAGQTPGIDPIYLG